MSSQYCKHSADGGREAGVEGGAWGATANFQSCSPSQCWKVSRASSHKTLLPLPLLAFIPAQPLLTLTIVIMTNQCRISIDVPPHTHLFTSTLHYPWVLQHSSRRYQRKTFSRASTLPFILGSPQPLFCISPVCPLFPFMYHWEFNWLCCLSDAILLQQSLNKVNLDIIYNQCNSEKKVCTHQVLKIQQEKIVAGSCWGKYLGTCMCWLNVRVCSTSEAGGFVSTAVIRLGPPVMSSSAVIRHR